MIIELGDLVSTSSDKIIGSGRITLEENEPSHRVSVSLEQLEKVVKIAKDLEWKTVTIRVQDDYPLFVSNMRGDKQEILWVLIAPIIDTD